MLKKVAKSLGIGVVAGSLVGVAGVVRAMAAPVVAPIEGATMGIGVTQLLCDNKVINRKKRYFVIGGAAGLIAGTCYIPVQYGIAAMTPINAPTMGILATVGTYVMETKKEGR